MDTLKQIVTCNDPVTMAVAAVISACLIWYFYRRKKGILGKAALCAVSKAEETWTSSTGKIKFAEVYTYLKKQFPLLTLFISERELSDIIEDALLEMKTVLLNKNSKATSKDQ